MEPTVEVAEKILKSMSLLSRPIANAFDGLKKDYRVVEALLRGNYEEYLKQSLSYYSRICSIIDPTSPIELEAIYVPLTLRAESKDRKIEVDAFPAELFRRTPQNVLIDSAGMGKSTLAKYIFLCCAADRAYLPIFIELRKLGEKEKLLGFIANEISLFRGTDFSEEIVLHLLRSGLFLLILDGVDEVASAQREDLSRGVKELLVACPKLPLLVTSRNDPLLTEFPALARWNIAPLTREKAYRLIHQYEKNADVAARLVATLKARQRSDPIESFLGTPLLVVLLVSSYEEKQIIPLQRNAFYYQVFDALFERHDSVKGGYVRQRRCGLSLDRFHKVLRAFSFTLLTSGISTFDKPTFFAKMDLARPLLPDVPCDAEALLSDLLSAVPLVLCEGQQLRFVHKSMMDYFAAEYVCRDLKEKQSEFLATLYKAKQISRFSETLRFCADIDFATFRIGFLKPLALDVVARCDTLRQEIASRNLSDEEKNSYVSLRFFSRMFVLRKLPGPNDSVMKELFAIAGSVTLKGGGIDSANIFSSESGSAFGLIRLYSHDFVSTLLQEHSIPFLYRITGSGMPMDLPLEKLRPIPLSTSVSEITVDDIEALESADRASLLAVPGIRVDRKRAQEFLDELEESEKSRDQRLEAFLKGLSAK